MRVHTLAKKLGISIKGLIDLLALRGTQVKNHMSTVDDGMVAELQNCFLGQTSELLNTFGFSGDAMMDRVEEFLDGNSHENADEILSDSIGDFEEDKIVVGKIVSISDDWVIVDVGHHAIGEVPRSHFEGAEIQVGDQVDVLIEEIDDSDGRIMLSKRKADRIKNWEQILRTAKEGDVVTGRVMRKIKGGFLIDIGVPAFLPASQIAIRRADDVAEYIGLDLECKIINIDEPQMNIVVSHRILLEERRDEMKSNLMGEIEIGQVRKGIVTNLTDFGAFIDLGGTDGLLHISDMSWGRINHPSELLAIKQEIDVMVLKIDMDRERISLGLKQIQPSPWDDIEERFPIGSLIRGKVVNVLSYGAFIELEEGIEGLVHVSEMSWARRITNPKEVVEEGQTVEVVVLEIKKEKQEISLGMKQVEVNPWEIVAQKYPVGHYISGKVRTLQNYGAFVELEDGIDGLLHVSDMSWTRKINHPSEIVEQGEEIQAVVLEVDQGRKRIALGLKQMEDDPWISFIPETYQVGTVLLGTVTKTTNYGIYVQMEQDPNLGGLVNNSQMRWAQQHIQEEAIQTGQEVYVKVIRVDIEKRKLEFSLKKVTEKERELLKLLYAESAVGDTQTEVKILFDTSTDDLLRSTENSTEHALVDTLVTEESISDSEVEEVVSATEEISSITVPPEEDILEASLKTGEEQRSTKTPPSAYKLKGEPEMDDMDYSDAVYETTPRKFTREVTPIQEEAALDEDELTRRLHNYSGRISIAEYWFDGLKTKQISKKRLKYLVNFALRWVQQDDLGKLDLIENSQNLPTIKIRYDLSDRVFVRRMNSSGTAGDEVRISEPVKHDLADQAHQDETVCDRLFGPGTSYRSITDELYQSRPRRNNRASHESSVHGGYDLNLLRDVFNSEFSEEGQLPFALDHEQYSYCREYGPLLISGGAGSGKTLIAINRLLAKIDIDSGRSPQRLYLTYTDQLRDEAKKKFDGVKMFRDRGFSDEIDFMTTGDLYKKILGVASEEEKDRLCKVREEFKKYMLGPGKLPSTNVLRFFEEFRGVLKSGENFHSDQLISLNDYLSLSKGRSLLELSERESFYDMARQFQKKMKKNRIEDDIDLVQKCLTRFSRMKDHDKLCYDEIVVDEVQDLTTYHLMLICKLCRFPQYLFFTGDDQQVLYPSRFQWNRAKTVITSCLNPGKLSIEVKGEFHLSVNYRCPLPILNLINDLWEDRQRYVREVLGERRRRHSCKLEGSRKGEDIGEITRPDTLQLKDQILADRQKEEDCPLLTPELMVIVDDPSNEKDLKQARSAFGDNLVFTAEESKGLESKFVLIWNHFEQEGENWKELLAATSRQESIDHYGHEFLLNRFNVTISRGLNWICFAHEWKPEWELWGPKRFLPVNKTKKTLGNIFNLKPTDDAFLQQAKILEAQKLFRQAASSYLKGEDKEGYHRCTALMHLSENEYNLAAEAYIRGSLYREAYDLLQTKEAEKENHSQHEVLKLEALVNLNRNPGNEDVPDYRDYFKDMGKIAAIPETAHIFASASEDSQSDSNRLHDTENYFIARTKYHKYWAIENSQDHRPKDGNDSLLTTQFDTLSKELDKLRK